MAGWGCDDAKAMFTLCCIYQGVLLHHGNNPVINVGQIKREERNDCHGPDTRSCMMLKSAFCPLLSF